MDSSQKSLGKRGEALAAEYLSQRGYQILGKNVRTPYGELDLIARQGEATVFVEVKTRRSMEFGWPEEAVTERKKANLIAAAQAYLQENPHLDGDWRIDVIAIQLSGGRRPAIAHFENAVV